MSTQAVQPSAPNMEYLCSLSAQLGQPTQVGDTPAGQRLIVPVVSGSVQGPRLNGTIQPAMSGDWLLVRPDGVGSVDVRGTIETDDGAFIYINYRGYLTNVPDNLPRWIQGEDIPHDDYYFAVTPYFETGAPQYAWLQQVVTVGIGSLIPGGVYYEFFALT